jgi:hypothetical protein
MSDDREPKVSTDSLALVGLVSGLLTVAALVWILLI